MIIVIDPGHGGENEGTIEDLCGRIEKDMTLKTSRWICEELSKYDDAQIYMTRDSDIDLSLKERAEYAKSVSADFLFSIHYNASMDHSFYGSEVWIPSEQPYMKQGFEFATPMLHLFKDEGLFIRGARIRLNSKGQNYYGIIRESTSLGIPSVIIEHCHIDNERDIVFCDSDEDMKYLATLDAKAIAGYLGLKKDGKPQECNRYTKADENTAFNPYTDPEYCEIELEGLEDDKAQIRVKAEDSDSLLFCYDYSLDGGLTFSGRIDLPGYDYFEQKYDKDFTCSIKLPEGRVSEVIFRVYNIFDDKTESNCLKIEVPKKEKKEPEKEALPEPVVVAKESSASENEEPPAVSVPVVLLCAAFFAVLITSTVLIRVVRRRRHIKLRQRKK